MITRKAIPAFLLSLILACAAFAQQRGAAPATPAESGDTIEIRTYSVADLIRTNNNYPFEQPSRIQPEQGGSLRAPAPGGRDSSGRTPTIEIDALITLIQDTIDSSSWENKGGSIGRVSSIGTMLVVTQKELNHAAIQKLLEDIRRNTSPAQVLAIRATWVQTAAKELLTPTTEVSADWIAKQKIYCESQITCFSGQTVHISSGITRNFVSDLTPIVGTNAVAFDPTMQSLLSGVSLQVSPQLTLGNSTVILDVQSSASEAPVQDAPIQVSATAMQGGSQEARTIANIDRKSVTSQEFQTTVRVPLNRKVIVGGMSIAPSAPTESQRQLYLVVEIDFVK